MLFLTICTLGCTNYKGLVPICGCNAQMQFGLPCLVVAVHAKGIRIQTAHPLIRWMVHKHLR